MNGLVVAGLAWLVGSVLFAGVMGLFMRCGRKLQQAEDQRWAALVDLPSLTPAPQPSNAPEREHVA